MATRESYENGVFCWTELKTTDAQAAQTFLTSLFGWSFEDIPVGDGMVYSPASLDGKVVAAIYQTDQPAGWLSYVAVDDADAVAGRVHELGGTVVEPPFDVMQEGRTAVIKDPAGAEFALWQPNRMTGAALVNAPGAMTWNDLQTSDVAAAVEFYSGLFDWSLGAVEDAPDERHLIAVGDTKNGGMSKLGDALQTSGVPSHWIVFFGVEDAEKAAAAAKDAGGSVAVEPTEIPSGRLAVLADPHGVPFGIVDGDFDD